METIVVSSSGAFEEVIAAPRQSVSGCVGVKPHHSERHGGKLDQIEFESDDGPEVVSGAADRPEQFGFLLGAAAHVATVGGDQLGAAQRV